MIERIKGCDIKFPEVAVQYTPNLMQIGIGLEPNGEVPGLHFVDAIYGGVPSQTMIGKIFFERRRQDFQEHMDFETGLDEANFYNQLGRDILDAVTGSSSTNSLWTWFDRPAVNRMIRLLRKARDASFGKDE